MPTDRSDFSGLKPAFAQNSIPVAFAANNRFVPMFAACLQSLMDHASDAVNYDVVLLQTDVSAENKALLQDMVRQRRNTSLRFFDVSPLIAHYRLKANAHITIETYFRFLIQSVLPEYDKVLYLDCDLIVNADVAELYATNVDGFMLAAVYDVEFSGHLHGASRLIQRYILKDLRLKDPSGYFQAGVLLLNEKEMRKKYSLEQWLTFASVPHRYNDQDVLNLYCEGHVKYLDMAWNLITDCAGTRISDVIAYAAPEIQAAYHQAHAAPKIIHYAGHRKPWHDPTEDLAHYFWSALKKTPYYEQGLFAMCKFAAEAEHRRRSWLWKAARALRRVMRSAKAGS